MRINGTLGLALSSSLLVGLAVHLGGCSGSSEAPASDASDSAIIGGVDAKGRALDAVGAILYRDPQTQKLQELCSATLVGPQTILTAKHCAVQFGQQAAATDGGAPTLTESRFIDSLEMFFAIGPDINAPKRTIKLDSVSLCNDYAGGWVGLGCDVSVYHLAEAVTDVTPLAVATATPDDTAVGRRFTAVGYGAQNVAETKIGTRKAGALTLRATKGAPLQTLYPTVDAFAAAVNKDEGAAFTSNNADALTQMYNLQLKAGYEVFLGGAPGDVQVCHGDSGGPLLAKVEGKLVVQGVASAVGLSGAKLPCNMGAIYAVVGPAAQELLKAALTDPCDGIPAEGRCDGDVAVRCTNADEGPRRVVRTDCGELVQHCAISASDDAGTSAVACVD